MTSSVVADKEFYAFEIGFYSAVNVNLGTINVHYAYVNEPPMVNHHCPINPSVDSEICDVQSTYQLLSNPALSVQWRLESAFDENNNPYQNPGEAVTVTPSGNVTFHDVIPADGETGDEIIYNGEFTFIATAVSCPHQPQCTDTVVIRRGIISYDNGCAEPIFNEDGQSKYELSKEIHDTSGALISISDIHNNENILDDDFTNYAEYTGGLSIASNIHVIGVKTSDLSNFTISAESDGKKVAKRIGFVVESQSTFLNANVLQFFQIRCYKKNGSETEEVYRQLVDESNAIGVGLIESDQSQKVRFSIEVPADKEFDEFSLWTAGVLKLDISTLRIYYPFIEDNSLDCGDPLKCAEAITAGNGATAYPDMKFQTASIAGVVQNLGNLIDNDPDSYFLYQNTVQAGSGMVVTVKLGKTLDYRHQFGIIMDNETFLASVGLGTWMTIETYYNGQPTGDKFDDWGVLGLNLIGYGDKRYLVNQPTRNFDEVRITFAGIANVLNGYKLYGLFFRSDKNLNGIADCMDPDDSCAEDLNLSVDPVCVGEYVVLDGQVQGGGEGYKVIVKAPDQDYVSEAIEVGSDKFGEKIKIPTKTFGTGLSIMVYATREKADGSYETGNYLDGVTYTVHPTRAEWRKTPINTDWNEPNNWDGNVNPYCCTDVVIPDGAERYPVLPTLEPTTDEDGNEIPVDPATYCCNGIYFKASPDGDADNPAQVVNVPELAYAKAWVDVRMMPNRYYMFAAPLKNTHTGDLFVPAEMNGQQTGMEFTDLDENNTVQNRFNPRIFQRMWKTNPYVRYIDEIEYIGTTENRTDHFELGGMDESSSIMVTDWSKVFNAMAHTYNTTQGFSVWVDNGDMPADQAVIMRLPKQNAYYNYYTPDGNQLPEHEGYIPNDNLHEFNYTDKTKLDRTDNSRFIYETKGYNELGYAVEEKKENERYQAKKADDMSGGELTITLTTESGSTSFVCNNPFMSDVDIKTFLQENENVTSLRRYNGDTYETYALSEGQLVANVTVSVESEDEDGNVVTGDEEVAVSRKPVIHPLESFFVDATSEGTRFSVVFTRGMMLNTVAAGEGQQPNSVPMLRVTAEAEAGGRRAAMLVADSTAGINVETMLDAEVAPTVAVFAATGGKACDMVSTSAAEIPLGVVMAEADTLRFSFSAEGGVDLADWELVDRADGSVYGLDGPVEICGTGSNVGRFVLRSRSRMAEEMAAGGNRVYVACRGGEAVATASAGFRIGRMDVYTVDGVMYGSGESADGATCAVKVPRGSVVVIRVTGDGGDVETFKMLTP